MIYSALRRLYWRATSAAATLVAFAMFPHFELANIVMAYVLASTIAAVRFGRGPAVVADPAVVGIDPRIPFARPQP